MEQIDERFNNLRFIITEQMNNTMIELIMVKQMLEKSLQKDSKTTDEERGLLYLHFEELKNDFIKDFKKNNKEQIKKYNDIINKQKNKEE